MKKSLLAITVSLTIYGHVFAQNTFPTSGNVGIGTTTPTANLDIRGTLSNTPGDSFMRLGDPVYSFWSGLRLNGTSDLSFDYFTGGAWGTAMTILHSNGNVGIGTTNPGTALQIGDFNSGSYNNQLLIPGTYNFEQVKLGQTSNGDAALEFVNHINLALSYGVKLVANVDEGAPGLQFQYAAPSTSYSSLNYATGLYMDLAGNVGVGTVAPTSLFQVDDGCTKASIGDASGTALNYGTSYLGFNASRSGTNWFTNNDGANNGGGVIYSSIFGDMYFSTIPTTGNSGQTLTDANVASKIAMRIDHTDGAVYAKQIYVQTSGWPDFVFKKDYALRPLSEVKAYIDQNQHLPDMPAAEKVEKDGINLGEMNKALDKKVEELTLYLIEKDKKEKEQQEINKSQQQQIDALKQQLAIIAKTLIKTNLP